MSRKVKKQASSLSFSFNRWFQKISTARPSSFIVTVIVIGSVLLLFSGGLYDAAVHPNTYIYYNQKFYFIASRTIGGSLTDQFTSETVISGALYAFGLIGLLAIYQSTKHAYSPRQAYLMLIVGVTLLFLAYVFMEVVFSIKTS